MKLLDESLEALEVRFVRQSITSYEEILKAWTMYLKKKRIQCPNCVKIINPICPKCNHKLAFRLKEYLQTFSLEVLPQQTAAAF